MSEAFSQPQALNRVIAEHQRVFQIKALGIRAVEPLIKTGSGQVISGASVTQFEHAFGVDQCGNEVIMCRCNCRRLRDRR
ncbi:hypothetical protein PMI19_03047 [Pseudomonas sp. GM16]|nr:hypothetical protein PMI19_03047 [Pseudomonas sp. GM16]